MVTHVSVSIRSSDQGRLADEGGAEVNYGY